MKRAGNTEFTSKSLSLSMSDHSCTHVDAPVHFNPAPDAPSIDQVPLENFYTEAICLDFGEVPNRYEATIDDMEAALAASGEEIKAGDTVMIHMGIHNRLYGSRTTCTSFRASRCPRFTGSRTVELACSVSRP